MSGTPIGWRGRAFEDMTKAELIDVIGQLVRAQASELEFVRRSRDKWMNAAFADARVDA